MKNQAIFLGVIFLLLSSCGSVEKLTRHGFETGYYNVKSKSETAQYIFAERIEDSLTIFHVTGRGQSKEVDTVSYHAHDISHIHSEDYFFNKTFIKNSIDFDLTTALLKYRLPQKNVPRQLSANLNAAIYVGFRKDYYLLRTRTNPLHREISSLHHFGFDFGPFAGIGSTPVNSSFTENKVEIEYDGIVFQKGIAVYFGINFLTFGFSMGFDNLLDENHKDWIFNNKPWIGLMLGIANF